MKPPEKLIIGLFGFGVVGEGLYQILRQTPSLNVQLKKVCIKHPAKNRNAPSSLFTTNKEELLGDPEINVIIEVIDDAAAAFEIVTTALRNGKAVVSASKKMIAENLATLLELQQETGQPFLYESAACASIPVIRNLEEYYDNDLLHSLQGIVNGSTNFILTRISAGNLDFEAALKLAQEAGFAESNPTLDVEGFDAAHKWVILLAHAYGIVTGPEALLFSGIRNVRLPDVEYAKQYDYVLKLVAHAAKLPDGSIAAFILPQFCSGTGQLAHIKDEYNGIIIESGLADKQFFYGKGAGGLPTGSAVLSDISALRYGYQYEYKKRSYQPPALSDNFYLKVVISFSTGHKIPESDFECIEERHYGLSGGYLTGILHYSILKNKDWWRQPGISLILAPDALLSPSEFGETARLKEAIPAFV
jgi:homoserine dehydrogenase